jgi:peroxin-6
LREGHNILLDTKSGSPSLPFRIMMLEPVAQGYLSPTTKIIVSEVLFDPADQDEEGWLEGSTYEASSHGKTNLSMADFDPDAFLSSSLGFASHAHSNGPDIDGDIDQSESSASGSITPRPPGTAFVPSSPPVDPLQLEDLDGLDSDGAGTRFSAVQSIGVSGEDENVCWVSVGGLGRAGIFEGDWVSLRRSGWSLTKNRSY